jgi:hypothetical protein
MLILSLFGLVQSKGPDLYTLVRDYNIGSTFCQFLAWKMQIHHKTDCKQPTCSWDNWQDAQTHGGKPHKESQQKRIVLSYGHNGFGNQLWEHTVGFMIAESLNARLLIAKIPDELSPGGMTPPNTWAGVATMERLLPHDFLYDKLPKNSTERQLCESEPFVVYDRPRDWRDRNYASSFKEKLYDLITDTKPRCIKLIGYFQNLPLCADDVRALWTPNMFGNFTMKPGENDVSVYLRCQPRHYHFNGAEFYDSILSRMKYDKLWLFMAPECPNPAKLDADPAKDGFVAAVVRLLADKYKGKRWPSAPAGSDDEIFLLHDLAGLAQSRRLVIPVSSWAFWAGVLSNATEIHVNSPPKHQLMPASAQQYIYHDEKEKKFFGRFDKKEGDIIYTVDGAKEPPPPVAKPVEKQEPTAAATATATATATGGDGGGGDKDGKTPAQADPAKIADLAAAVDAAAAKKDEGGNGAGAADLVKIEPDKYDVGATLLAVQGAIKALGGRR